MPNLEAGREGQESFWSVRDGTGRFSRLPQAMREGHFRVDELTFEQIVAMAREYASLVVFHDLDDSPAGPWRELFTGSEVAILATILATPVDRMEKAYLAGQPMEPFRTKTSLLGLFGRWADDLRRSRSPVGLEVRSLLANLAVGAQESYLASLQAIRIVQEASRRLLPNALADGEQEPAAAMLFAFARLYADLQRRVGRFASRRTDFYYGKILHERPRGGMPDTVDLVLSVAVDREIEIPPGTEFVGEVDGTECVFSTEEAVTVNGAKIEDILTLHQASEPRTDGGGPEEFVGAWCDRIDGAHPRALFGAPRDRERSESAWSARIGLVLADPVFLMREGLGRIVVTFEFARDSIEGTLLERKREAHDPDRLEMEAFYQQFRNCLRISYTGPTGWTEVSEYLPSCWMTDPAVGEGRLRIEIAVAGETHPFVPHSTSVHGEDHGVRLPMLRMELNDQDAPHPYGLLSRLVVRRAEIEVAVHDCRNLVIHNQIGQLSSHQPFMPFGPLPALGSHLVVGLAETRSKSLTDCRLHLRWDGLPELQEGFLEWYRDYGGPRSNDAFTASLAVLANGRWLECPAGDRPDSVRLFHTRMEGGGLQGIAQESEIGLGGILTGFVPSDPSEYDKPLEYGPGAKGAFFRLSLDAPAGAFGHAEYPNLLTNILMRNARIKVSKLASPMPNPPYTPVLSSISMDYTARSVVEVEERFSTGGSPSASCLFHLHPFGWEVPIRRGISGVRLVPDLGFGGNLFVGLRSAAPIRRIALHFHLSHDSTEMPAAAPRWSHLEADGWRALPSGAIKRDTTNGLTTSGIVTLEIPEPSSGPSSLMPSARLWLRIGTEKDPEAYSRILAIRAQALQAIRRGGTFHGEKAGILPAGCIQSARRNIPGVESVMQPTRSRGGRGAEDTEAFRIRMSKRLHHKGRAVDPTDYEHLVLEKFPEVYKAKCFANLSRTLPVRPAPGRVLVVPVPFGPSSGNPSQEATLDGAVLSEIQSFLQGLASGAVRVSVANPWYERLQVHCRVRFRGGGQGGRWMDSLERAIKDWLSPWTPVGNDRHFGWRIHRQELHAFLETLDFVERVEHFSILRLASDAFRSYRLDDSAGMPDQALDRIFPSVPWAVAVPMERHLLGEIGSSDREGAADPTGLGELAIGSTFVVRSLCP